MYATRRRFYHRSVLDQSDREAAAISAGAHARLLKVQPLSSDGHVNDSRGGSSQFDQMATGCALVSISRQAMLGVLLDATLAFTRGGRPVLTALWSDEAMQRAYNIIRLIVELERQATFSCGDSLGAATEYRVAMGLAEVFRSLVVRDDNEVRSCSDALRTAVRNLVELFGPVVGQVQVRTSVERIALPAFKRRALVLAACELVINALRHGFAGRSVGCITVTLCRTKCGQGWLGVADDGWGIPTSNSPQPCGIVFDLAALLESDVVYGAAKDGGTFAEIDFPISR
jgi:two-component sensor histidine kinase